MTATRRAVARSTRGKPRIETDFERPALDAAALLTVEEMYRADAAAMAAGVPGEQLMEAAGTAIAGEVRRRWTPRPTAIRASSG